MNLSINNQNNYKRINKSIILALLLIITTNVNAQWFGKKIRGNDNTVTKTRHVDDYDKIAVAGSFDIKLVAGTEGDIIITMDENLLEYLVTEVEGDKLKIRWEKGVNVYSNHKMLITIPFKDIDAVSLSGSGDIKNEDLIKADNFRTSLSGSGDIKLMVDTNSLASAISGSGDISIKGNTNKLDCSIAGSGDFDGFKLTANDVSIKISGSGDADVKASENLKVSIAGSGDVTYIGNPRQNVKISGSGSVSSR